MESAFQFSNPSLTKFEFGINDGFNNTCGSEVNFKINIGVNVKRNEDKNEAIVELNFEVGEKNDTCPYHISATEAAHFMWNEELNNDDVVILLNQNAPSLLLSYLRPVISQITAASPNESFDIPFINFTKVKN